MLIYFQQKKRRNNQKMSGTMEKMFSPAKSRIEESKWDLQSSKMKNGKKPSKHRCYLEKNEDEDRKLNKDEAEEEAKEA